MEEPLTVLQEKLAEAHGLAIAAGDVTRAVEERVPDPSMRDGLQAMRSEAEETRARCLRVEQSLGDGVAGAMLHHANSIHGRASSLLGAWFKAGTDALSAWSFLAMAEAGEVAAWAALTELARQSGPTGVAELAAWALPVQERHLALALEGAVHLAGLEDAASTRFG